ncbi:MAG: hypothetical protein COA60_004215 [Robiginitomaculum sp.]|nr:hypothetical protein [Robiginitomaculum sp.]
MSKQVTEVVEFRLKSGIDTASFIKEAQKSTAFIKSFDGFLNRTLCVNEDDLWMDIAQWRDMASAKAAGEGFMQAPEVQVFCEMIDMQTTKMQHLHVQLIS